MVRDLEARCFVELDGAGRQVEELSFRSPSIADAWIRNGRVARRAPVDV